MTTAVQSGSTFVIAPLDCHFHITKPSKSRKLQETTISDVFKSHRFLFVSNDVSKFLSLLVNQIKSSIDFFFTFWKQIFILYTGWILMPCTDTSVKQRKFGVSKYLSNAIIVNCAMLLCFYSPFRRRFKVSCLRELCDGKPQYFLQHYA